MKVGDRVQVPTSTGFQTGRVTVLDGDRVTAELRDGTTWQGDGTAQNVVVMPCPECHRRSGHKADCLTGGVVPPADDEP